VKRRGWLVLALAVVLGGAFLVQATSTWRLGDKHHLAGVALPALVMVLEVGSITGAALYLVTLVRGTRRRAGLLVVIAAGVGGYGGVNEYGFIIGVPVGLVLLLMVDTIGRFWHEPAPPVDIADSRDVDPPPSESRPRVESPVTLDEPAMTTPAPPLPPPRFTVQDVPHFEFRWAPAPPEPEPVTGPIAPPVTQLHPVPAKRTRKELETAGVPLGIKRRAGETVDSLRERVEAAETQARRARRAGT
jgi:hypothetical protein